MISAFEAIESEARRCAGDDVNLPNGTRFVRRLNHNQALRYLHKIYPPLPKEDLPLVCQYLGFPVPDRYQHFLLKCGGASLFDQSMHIFGYSGSITRALRLEDQRPINIRTPMSEFRASYQREVTERWSVVGSIVLFRKVWMAIDRGGSAGLLREDGTIELTDFDSMILRVMAILSAAMDCGPASTAGLQLEDSLFESTH